MYQLKFSIETQSPIIMSSMSNSTIMTRSHLEFSGSIIRGILATRYVNEQGIKDSAYDEADFLKLFYGDLKFLPANPESKAQRSFVLPLSLQHAKAGSKNNDVQDLLTAEKPEPGYKSFNGKYGVIKDSSVQDVSLKMNIFMHMSRNDSEERLSGKSTTGRIYNYESINKGQKFQGLIIGDEEDLNKLIDGLHLKKDSSMTAYAGRSRFTQYGKCKVFFEKPTKINLPATPADHSSIYLRLDTPLVPAAEVFINAKNILQSEVVDVLNADGGNFSLGKVFSSRAEIENFIGPWSMKRPRTMALAAGSVFELKADNLKAEDWKVLGDKIYQGFGERTEEGFGQLRLWLSETLTAADKNAKSKDEKESENNKPGSFSDKTKKIAEDILVKHCLEQIRIYAHEDAEKLRRQLKYSSNMTHFFSRLDGLLSDVQGKANLQKAFKQQIEEEIRDGTLFEEHINNLQMANGRIFYEVLTGQTKLPYEKPNRDLNSDLMRNKAKLDELLKKLDLDFESEKMSDAFYLEYFQNYFRFARKVAADEKGDEDE